MLDLASIQPVERPLEIVHPGAKKPIGVRVMCMSMDDDRMKGIKRRFQDERLKQRQKGQFIKSDEIDDSLNRLLFAAMTGWEWYNPTGKEGDDGYDADAQASFMGNANPEFNQKTVFAVFNAIPWFRDQINEHTGDESDFFINSN